MYLFFQEMEQFYCCNLKKTKNLIFASFHYQLSLYKWSDAIQSLLVGAV